NPVDATPTEQTTRAQILYNRSGAGQWPHCGRHLFE
ncbi:MAG: G5 domain-containing protein, partial [Actinomycetia bacterium]|nr:G5 domain-containing protein [bacterium]MCP5024765.1 G5 domain-containing protein [Actinomycetes bacterium]